MEITTHGSGEQRPVAPWKIADEILLLAEIITARADGSNDTRAGTSDEDLLYALEEAEPHLSALREQLK